MRSARWCEHFDSWRTEAYDDMASQCASGRVSLMVSAMRVVLEVTSEPAAGKRFWLRSGQTADIGRGSQAVFALPHDQWMSSLHFRVECDAAQCRLQDLDSRNGTTVNGQRVTRAELADGDVIVAGETHFRVQIEGAVPSERPEPRRTAPAVQAIAGGAPASGPTLRVGHWLCGFVPPGWEVVPNQGLRRAAEGEFPISAIFTETRCHEHLNLPEHVNTLIQHYLDALPGCRTQGAQQIKIPGTEEARQFVLEHPPRGEIALRQKYICVRERESFGMAVFTTSQDQLERSASVLDQILSGLAWQRHPD